MEYTDNTVLIVDDEQGILNSLKRLLKPLKCQVLVSLSPLEALENLKTQPVDVVISDMRMPEMGGECFLEQVANDYPETERIVITGYSDAQATIDAINRGQISRFMLKPWQDEEVLNVVKKGFEVAALRQENSRLQAETQEKNAELERLNQSLESKVQERTEQLKVANEHLKGSYRSVVRMFSALSSRRLGIKASGENQQLNKLMVAVASKTGVEGKELKQLFYAWQLRHIGKVSFPDTLLKESYVQMNPEQQREYQQHPVMAHAACLLVKPLYEAGQVILQHKEYLDGSGYPKGSKADDIKYRAQILCVVNDYVELINGLYDERHYSSSEALKYLSETAAERYNQNVVTILGKALEELAQEKEIYNDCCIKSHELKAGMMLSRDLISDEGILLLSADQIIDAAAIERIRDMEFNLQELFKIYVTQ